MSVSYFIDRLSKRFKFGSLGLNGRNSFGRICVFHRGGGNKYQYRKVDFHRRINLYGTLYNIIYDPNRTGFIGLILYVNGVFSQIILSSGVTVGSKLFSGDNLKSYPKANSLSNYSTGSSLPLSFLNLFDVVNNVELKPFFGASLARSAGSSLIVVAKELGKVHLKSKSGWIIIVPEKCIASLGYVSNVLSKTRILKKAGKNRNLGWRPVVRGVAMNPCDHPHGGGEGKKGSPRKPRTPWGKLTKGTPTKNKKIDRLRRYLFKKY